MAFFGPMSENSDFPSLGFLHSFPRSYCIIDTHEQPLWQFSKQTWK